jgi:hypothetical protein
MIFEYFIKNIEEKNSKFILNWYALLKDNTPPVPDIFNLKFNKSFKFTNLPTFIYQDSIIFDTKEEATLIAIQNSITPEMILKMESFFNNEFETMKTFGD